MNTPTLLLVTLCALGCLASRAEPGRGPHGNAPHRKEAQRRGESEKEPKGRDREQERKAIDQGEAVVAPEEHLRERIQKKFDMNQDGRLDESEKAAARRALEDRKGSVFKKLDTDGDGKLSDAEREVARDIFEVRKQHAMQKFDTNGDGKLDEEEKNAARKAMHEAFIKEHDIDGDGVLSPEEKAKIKTRPGDENVPEAPPADI